MADEVRFQRGTAERLAEVNLVLGKSEPCHEWDTGKLKIGDGVTAWNDLDYFIPGNEITDQDLLDHINSLAPHPNYDDGSSLILLYENAKV